jgi:hypothetical protein
VIERDWLGVGVRGVAVSLIGCSERNDEDVSKNGRGELYTASGDWNRTCGESTSFATSTKLPNNNKTRKEHTITLRSKKVWKAIRMVIF